MRNYFNYFELLVASETIQRGIFNIFKAFILLGLLKGTP